MNLLHGLIRIDRHQLSAEDKAQIIKSIGMLASMTGSLSEAIADSELSDSHLQNLAYTSSLLAEIIGELNGLLQT